MDMVAIPAYQSAMIDGNPDLKFFIRAGESIVPTGGNVKDMEEAQEEVAKVEVAKPKRKLSKWNKYVKKKANKIFLKNGKLDLKKMAKEFAKTQVKKQVKKQIKRRTR